MVIGDPAKCCRNEVRGHVQWCKGMEDACVSLESSEIRSSPTSPHPGPLPEGEGDLAASSSLYSLYSKLYQV